MAADDPDSDATKLDDPDRVGPSKPAASAAPDGASPGAASEETTEEGPEETPESAPSEASEEVGAPSADSAVPLAPPPPERFDGAVEAVLLAAGESVTPERLRDLLGVPSVVHVREALERISSRWREVGLPIELQPVAGGHRVSTRPEFAEYVRRLWKRPVADRLSATLLETLSVVAYKQPVARAEIERIRGVQCGESLRGLLDRRLIKVAGRSDQPGRPLLYATTARFLESFGLAGLEDLPSAKDLRRL